MELRNTKKYLTPNKYSAIKIYLYIYIYFFDPQLQQKFWNSQKNKKKLNPTHNLFKTSSKKMYRKKKNLDSPIKFYSLHGNGDTNRIGQEISFSCMQDFCI